MDNSVPGPSKEKQVCNRRFTLQLVLDKIENVSEIEADNDEYYPEDDLESESDDEISSEGGRK